MKRIYLTVLLGFISFVINAQRIVDFAKPKDSYDPLFKLTDIPVSLNNGMTNIEIPLYTISTKDIDLPIKLSYYSRGQKLSEISSEVGLGWNINVPYKISRQVAGIEDEGNDGYFYNDVYKKNIFKNRTELRKVEAYSNSGDGSSYDLEPDKFYLNLPNYSGKFIYDQIEGDFVMQDFEAYKIERIYGQSNTLNGFKVIDPNGNTYFFGVDRLYNNTKTIQSTKYVYLIRHSHGGAGGTTQIENPGEYASSWYLYKIVTKNQEEILFSYLPHTLNYFDRGYEETGFEIYETYYDVVYNSKFSNYDIDDRAIDFITYNNEKIKFNYVEREDVLTGDRLESIIISDKRDKPIKKIELNYSYTNAPQDYKGSNPYLRELDPSAQKRLYLDQIIVNGLEKTYFSYFNRDELPNRFSNSFDRWGFYNNKFNGLFVDTSEMNGSKKNQSVNPLVTHYGLLREITYPTKGTTTFEYENNSGYLFISDPKVPFKDLPYVNETNGNENLIYGEGNRIKSIINNSNTGKIEKKSYIYKSLDNKNNTGRIIGYPYYYTILGYIHTHELKTVYDPFGIRPGSLMSSYNVNSLIYSEVTEYIGDVIQNNGKIHYKFSNDLDGGKYYRWPYYTSIDNEYLRGKLLNKKVYKNDNNQYKLISEEVNQYDFKDPFFKDYINLNNGFLINNGEKMSYYLRNKDAIIFPIPRFYANIEGKFSDYTPDDFFLINIKNDDPFRNMYFQPFYFVSVKKYLTNQKNIQYFDNGTSIITETNYNYDSQNHLQLSKQTTQNSKNETLTTEYQYPPDLVSGYEQSSLMEEMTDKNMIANPIITTSKNGETVLSEQRILYQLFPGVNENLILPKYVYSKKGEKTTVDDRKITYNSYDTKGNLLQYTLENGIPVSIIWGYNEQYPVLKVEGATYSQVVSKFDSGLLGAIKNGDLTSTSFNGLRNTLPNTMITSYTYKPLVGVTSITGPNGQTEYYKYDAANRLEEIRNDRQEVLKTFQYNYKQP
ncbi:hypothetical protein [Empedobacter tilapiae]